MDNTDADGHAEDKGEPPEKLTLADDPATVERKLGKPQDELWHEYEAKGYSIILRRSPGEPYGIHPISIGEPEKK